MILSRFLSQIGDQINESSIYKSKINDVFTNAKFNLFQNFLSVLDFSFGNR